MFLKRLELQGFKSFADKTVLEFGQGVTSVVGPNGSGKSNISDAIRWVMGEMSAKSLRGSNMQDVIFSGTEKRRPLNYAEVSLVLDNSDRVFPLEFDEVIVTRRVFRSGETAYQINRSSCRLKDIHELFMDTGLGRDGYSIIGQGNVSQILSTKAEDRRSLFEEAAGVSKYKYRKEEALRKLKGTEENLVRICDITGELEGRLGPLKNQSEKARKYLSLYEEMKALDVDLAVIALEQFQEKKDDADRLFEAVSGELEDLRQKESETEALISGLYDQSREKDEESRRKNNELIETRTKIMECGNEISIAENNMKNNTAAAARIEGEVGGIAEQNQQRRQRIQELQQEIQEKDQALKTQREALSALKDDGIQLSEKKNTVEKAIETKKDAVTEALNQVASKRERIAGIEKLRENHRQRQEAVEEEIAAFESGVERTRAEIEAEKGEIQKLREKNETIKKQIEASKSRRDQLETRRREISEEGNQLKVAYNSKMSKRRILEDMENDYEGYAKSVKAVLKAQELRGRSIYGTVAGLIDVDKRYAVAVEMALGGALQNIVVEDEQDAKAAISFLRDHRAGRATFLPISSVKGRSLENLAAVSKAEGFIGVASELIRYQSQYDGIMKNLLGRVVVVDTMDHGIRLSRQFGYKFKTVTLEGDILNAGGSLSGGSVHKTGSFLSRAADIKELKQETVQLDGQLQELRETFSKIETQLHTISAQLDSFLPISREYENGIIRRSNTVEHLEQSLAGSGSTREGLEREREQLQDRLAQSARETAALLNEIRREEAELEKMDEQIHSLNSELEAVSREQEIQSDKTMEYTLSVSGLERDISGCKQSIQDLKTEIQRASGEAARKKDDAAQMLSNNQSMADAIEEKKKLSQTLEGLVQELERQIAAVAEQKASIVEKLQEIQGSNKDLTDRLINLQKELGRIENRQANLNMQRENLINRLWDDYELTVTDAEAMKRGVEDEKGAGERLAQLKRGIKALGSVNMEAIEEYKAVCEKYEFLSRQKADLEKAKANLNEIIRSTEELMKEHFTQQFSVINESFSKVFTELFGGGRGRLYLQDPSDVLESGIEIEVQLPGKGLQNINLYSGGEKSFIAIALLFAILRVKPAPFCILDEIDAALDDVNVSRFATYLKNYLDQSQFIVITHRRGTMEAANIMYGVTMQEKGVSKLLSLHIDEVGDDMVEG